MANGRSRKNGPPRDTDWMKEVGSGWNPMDGPLRLPEWPYDWMPDKIPYWPPIRTKVPKRVGKRASKPKHWTFERPKPKVPMVGPDIYLPKCPPGDTSWTDEDGVEHLCPVCGNGICQEEFGQNCQTCPEDCGECPVECGDGICSHPEEFCGNCMDCAPPCFCNPAQDPECPCPSGDIGDFIDDEIAELDAQYPGMQGMLSLFLTAETESGEVALSKEMTSAPPGTILHELKSQFSILVNNLWGVYSQGQLYERAAVLLRAICQFLPTETVPLVGEPAVVAPGKFQGNEWKNHFLKYPGSDAWANGPIEPWLDQSTSIARLPVVRQIGSAWSTGTMLVYMPPSTCSYTPQFVYGILLRYLVLIRGVSPTLVPSDYAESWHTYATWKPDAYMVCCDEKG